MHGDTAMPMVDIFFPDTKLIVFGIITLLFIEIENSFYVIISEITLRLYSKNTAKAEDETFKTTNYCRCGIKKTTAQALLAEPLTQAAIHPKCHECGVHKNPHQPL